MKRKILGMAMALAMTASLIGCGSGGDDAQTETPDTTTEKVTEETTEPESTEDSNNEGGAVESKDPADIVVAYAIKGQNAWLEQQAVGCQAACEELGLPSPTIVYAESQQDAESQVKAIEDFMALGADIIIIDPISATVARQALTNAKEQGVVVIDTDTVGELTDLTYASVGLDEYTASYEGATEFATSYLEEGDGVVIIAGEQGDANAENRLKGMTEACEANGIAVLGHQYTDWTPAKTTDAMEDFITNYGDEMKGVLVPSDDMAMGAITALEQANKIDQVKIMGYGGFQVAIDAIENGTMSMTVGMHPYMCGYEAVKIGYDIIVNDKYPAEQFIDVGTDLITTENYTEFDGF